MCEVGQFNCLFFFLLQSNTPKLHACLDKYLPFLPTNFGYITKLNQRKQTIIQKSKADGLSRPAND